MNWRGWLGSNKVTKLLQGLLRKPGQQLDGAGPGVHHGKLREGDTTYLKVKMSNEGPKADTGTSQEAWSAATDFGLPEHDKPEQTAANVCFDDVIDDVIDVKGWI